MSSKIIYFFVFQIPPIKKPAEPGRILRASGATEVLLLHDHAGGEVVGGNREIDQAEGEEGDDGFHGKPPGVFVFSSICVIALFSFPLYGIYDEVSRGNISEDSVSGQSKRYK